MNETISFFKDLQPIVQITMIVAMMFIAIAGLIYQVEYVTLIVTLAFAPSPIGNVVIDFFLKRRATENATPSISRTVFPD